MLESVPSCVLTNNSDKMTSNEQQLAFREMVAHVAREVDDLALDNLKYQCRGKIGPGRLERMETASNLFETLEERDEINYEEVDFLYNILKNVGRVDLAKVVLKYSNSWALKPCSNQDNQTSMSHGGGSEPGIMIGNSSVPMHKGFTLHDPKEKCAMTAKTSHGESSPADNSTVPFHTQGYNRSSVDSSRHAIGDRVSAQRPAGNDVPPQVTTALEYVISSISRGWQSAARHLGVPDAVIDNAEDNWPRNIRNQIREAFTYWARNGTIVSVPRLIEAMRHVGRNDIADEIQYG